MTKLNASKQRRPSTASANSLNYGDRATVGAAKLAANRAAIEQQEEKCREYLFVGEDGKMTKMVRGKR